MAASTEVLTPAPERPANAATPAPPIAHDWRSEEERELVEWVYDLNESSERAMAEEAGFDRFDDWLEAFWGPVQPATFPSYRPPINANILKHLVLTEVSDLTDSDPRIVVLKDPRRWERDRAAELMLRSFWSRHQVNLQIMEALVWSFIAPAGFVTAVWDPSAERGLGEIRVRARDPRTVKPSPYAVGDDESQCQYVILEDILELPYIRQRWRDQGHRVQPEDTVSIKAPERPGWRSSPGRYYGPLTGWQSAPDTAAVGYRVARARVLSCFVDDTAEETLPDVLRRDDGTVLGIRVLTRRRYPFGRLIQVANRQLLYNGPSPYRMFPVVRIQSQPSPGSYWHSSFVGDFLPMQQAADQLDSQVVENAVRLNQGIVVAEANSGLDVENFASIPGQLVLLRHVGAMDIKYPPPMPTDMVQAGQRLRSMIKEMAGFPPSRLGGTRQGNVGADLTETEISQGQAITRLRARLLYRSIQRLAALVFSLMADFYKTPRPIPLAEEWEGEPVAWQPLVDSADYAIHVDPASVRPVSRTLIRRQAPHLYRIGALGPKALHEALETPNRVEVVKELDERAARLAQIEMLKRMRKTGAR